MRFRSFPVSLIVVTAALGCQSAGTQPSGAHTGASASTAQATEAQAAAGSVPGVTIFTGTCDASGAVELAGHLFAVGDDEDNVLRVYDADRGGNPVFAVDLSPQLELDASGKKKKKRPPETDIEAGTRLGDIGLWLTSHGRNSKGKLKTERFRFFATTTATTPSELKVVGKVYHQLLDDVIAEPRLARFGLNEASERAPKEEGGLNIEGMTARPEGGVWIGFRNPNPGGKALLVPFLNPDKVVMEGERARFGDPLLLDLGGLGVRALSWWKGRYLIVAGHYSGDVESRLFEWDGKSSAKKIDGPSFADFNPEGFFTPEARDRVMLLSDDGARMIGDKQCKKVKDHSAKSFRGRWLPLQ